MTHCRCQKSFPNPNSTNYRACSSVLHTLETKALRFHNQKEITQIWPAWEVDREKTLKQSTVCRCLLSLIQIRIPLHTKECLKIMKSICPKVELEFKVEERKAMEGYRVAESNPRFGSYWNVVGFETGSLCKQTLKQMNIFCMKEWLQIGQLCKTPTRQFSFY